MIGRLLHIAFTVVIYIAGVLSLRKVAGQFDVLLIICAVINFVYLLLVLMQEADKGKGEQ